MRICSDLPPIQAICWDPMLCANGQFGLYFVDRASARRSVWRSGGCAAARLGVFEVFANQSLSTAHRIATIPTHITRNGVIFRSSNLSVRRFGPRRRVGRASKRVFGVQDNRRIQGWFGRCVAIDLQTSIDIAK